MCSLACVLYVSPISFLVSITYGYLGNPTVKLISSRGIPVLNSTSLKNISHFHLSEPLSPETFYLSDDETKANVVVCNAKYLQFCVIHLNNFKFKDLCKLFSFSPLLERDILLYKLFEANCY
jgi:hypothetical protein